ncbi:hypothetical protein KO500_03755 [Cellulophaga baltica]|uniref:hypothetical protein n=1 Tax=Cellulophaga TaxID=104264 RepID=UPI001C0737ED|nr:MULTISPECIES: hypothetical protein [Cellulophaga]MBU2995529.1 hypothetical protein [Cellulophaga baltica]MDO6766923.1 hypothetical protein [Cellulophaga sp. 1_MG-2023]
MMRIIGLLLCFFVFEVGYSQYDTPKTQTLNIKGKEETSNVSLLPEKKQGLSLNMPDLLKKPDPQKLKDSLDPKISMLPNKDLVQAGEDLELDAKVKGIFEGSPGKHFPDMYLGDVKSSGSFIGIVCRDHQFVDGDLIKITVNGVEVEPKMFLTGAFKGVNVDLKDGFNRVEFTALNEGSSSPNTAQINAYDDKGKLIFANQWTLSAGSVATFVVVKE